MEEQLLLESVLAAISARAEENVDDSDLIQAIYALGVLDAGRATSLDLSDFDLDSVAAYEEGVEAGSQLLGIAEDEP